MLESTTSHATRRKGTPGALQRRFRPKTAAGSVWAKSAIQRRQAMALNSRTTRRKEAQATMAGGRAAPLLFCRHAGSSSSSFLSVVGVCGCVRALLSLCVYPPTSLRGTGSVFFSSFHHSFYSLQLLFQLSVCDLPCSRVLHVSLLCLCCLSGCHPPSLTAGRSVAYLVPPKTHTHTHTHHTRGHKANQIKVKRQSKKET